METVEPFCGRVKFYLEFWKRLYYGDIEDGSVVIHDESDYNIEKQVSLSSAPELLSNIDDAIKELEKFKLWVKERYIPEGKTLKEGNQ
jgi:hypothetical protein